MPAPHLQELRYSVSETLGVYFYCKILTMRIPTVKEAHLYGLTKRIYVS